MTSANATTGSSEGQTQSVSKTAEKSKKTITVVKKKTRTAMEIRNLPQQKKWVGVPTKAGEKGKSLLELQREELEGRLTEENLRRLEIGKKPAKSPLVDRLNQAIESGQ